MIYLKDFKNCFEENGYLLAVFHCLSLIAPATDSKEMNNSKIANNENSGTVGVELGDAEGEVFVTVGIGVGVSDEGAVVI